MSPSADASLADQAPAADGTPSAAGSPLIDVFDAVAAHRFAVDLANLGPREAGTDGDRAAQVVITNAFEDAGWQVLTQDVDLPQGGTTRNLIAVRDPVDLDGPHVVVGGHHDSIGGGPGANDNATGIGVLTTLARQWRDEPAPVPVVLVAFGAEEYQPAQPRLHHLGSDAYAGLHSQDVIGALIVDMVGNGDTHCICWLDRGPATMANRVLAVAMTAGLGDRVAVEARGDVSDHGPFARRGVPAAFLWSYSDGRLHTPNDTAEHLVVDDIGRAGTITLAFLRSLVAADAGGLRAEP